MKHLKILFFFFIFILIVSLPCFLFYNQEPLPNHPITTKSTKSPTPFSFYSIYAYDNADSGYTYEKNMIYYQIQENANEPFNDLKIYIENDILDDFVFEEYNAIVFLEKTPYTYRLDNLETDENNTLTINLSYYANTETNNSLNGGMILIPKWYTFDDIKFTVTNDYGQNYIIIEKRMNSSTSTKYYSPFKVSPALIQKYNLQKYNTIYYAKITNIDSLNHFIKDFDLEVDSSELESYQSLFEYRNLILLLNDDFYFSCYPETSEDKNYNELWETEKVTFNVTVTPKTNETKFSYITFNFIPKEINLDTINFHYSEKEIKNYDNNEIKITKEQALNIANNYFDQNSNVAIDSFIGIYNENYISFLYAPLLQDYTYRNMWSLSGIKDSLYRTIFVDATTGEIKIEM